MPSYDFIQDCLENMESQGFDYYLVVFDRDKNEENDKIVIYTTFDEEEMKKISKAIKENSKKTSIKKRKNDSSNI